MTAATDEASEVAAILIERDIEWIARSMVIREFQSLHILLYWVSVKILEVREGFIKKNKKN